MKNDHDDIKNKVREIYGLKARSASLFPIIQDNNAFCTDEFCEIDSDAGTEAYPNLYLSKELDGLPVEAIAASAGCGNPTALADLKPGEKVLDLGSGGGIDCFLAARQVGDYGHVIGLDMTSDMISLARKNAENLGAHNVEFIHSEMEKIPLPSESVNVVISNCVICLSPDKEAVITEAFRVLVPGGRIHISDMMALGPSVDGAEPDLYEWACCIAGAEEQDVYTDRLARAGFIGVSVTRDGEAKTQEGGRPSVASVKVVASKPV